MRSAFTTMQRLLSTQAMGVPRVVFSGIQPTGIPHLGNYVGALRQWAQFQHKEPDATKLLYSIVDLHAITVPQQRDQFRRWRKESMASLLAVGLNPECCTIFYQSSVSLVDSLNFSWLVTDDWVIGSSTRGAHVDLELYCLRWLPISHDPVEGRPPKSLALPVSEEVRGLTLTSKN
jgi:tryptophanyl-tRNA synthetase